MIKQQTPYIRNPLYIFFTLGSFIVFLVTALFARNDSIGPLENALFEIFYRLPSFFTPFAIAITLLGAVAVPLLISVWFVVRRRADIALRISGASVLAFATSQLISSLIQRPQPSQAISGVVERASLPITSFPSSYAAVAIAAGLMLAVYLPRNYRKWVTIAFLSSGCAQIYLGQSLPLDIVAGWLIGIFAYSATLLALGSRYSPVETKKLARILSENGLKNTKLKPAAVDARGSVPFFGSYDGGDIFVKVFNQDNNAADWLFKMIRRLQYRRLEDEVPSLTPKRAIEHEAYLTMLATHKAKVRVPEFLGIFKVGSNSYAMVLRRLSAEGLDSIAAKKVTDDILGEVWKQILLLHKNGIIHKDLRCANVMIETQTKLPWLIDFGFSEAAMNHRSFYKDNVEFIASSATKVGPKRAVSAALKALGKAGLADALPYMQYAALSGATTTALKQKPGLIDEIRAEMSSAAESNGQTKARIARLQPKR